MVFFSLAFWARASACSSSGRSAKKLTTSVSGFTASVDVMLDKAAFVVGTSMRPETLAASFHATGKRLTALHWSLGWPHHWPGWECLWGQRVVPLRVSSARIGLLLHPWHSVPLLSMASLDAITLGVDHLTINRRCAALRFPLYFVCQGWISCYQFFLSLLTEPVLQEPRR